MLKSFMNGYHQRIITLFQKSDFFFIFEMFQNRQALGHLTPQFTCTTPAVLKYVDLPTRIHSLGVKNLA